MGVLFQPRRPIARWAAAGVTDDRTDHQPHRRPAVRPSVASEYLPPRLGDDDPCPGTVARALDALATGDAAILPELFTGDVVGWWPNFAISSRRELELLMLERDDALADAQISSRRFCVGGDRVAAEWLLTARHASPWLVGDDVLIEPTNRQVVLAGVTLARLRDDRVDQFHHYFDDTTILEQVLRPPPA